MVPGQAAVNRYYDEDESHHLDIFTSANEEGIVAATIGLMDYDRSRRPGVPVYIEILLDKRGHAGPLANIASTMGFFIMKDGWKPAPGVVFETMVEMYLPQSALKHVVFVPPFQWREGMSRVTLGEKVIHPLLAVPISEAESALIADKGMEALEAKWLRQKCDVLDWGRSGAA